MDSLKREIQGYAAGLGREQLVKTGFKLRLFPLAWVFFVNLQLVIEVPNLGPDIFNRFALFIINANHLIYRSFGMDPTKGMQEYIELSSVVADDNDIRIQAVLKNTPKKRTFRCNTDMPFGNDAQILKSGFPLFSGSEVFFVMVC
jgi:hypothetical protein